MKTEELLLLGGACFLGLYLFKDQIADLFGGGGGGGGGGEDGPVLPIPPPPGDGGGSRGPGTVIRTTLQGTPVYAGQQWTGTTFGQPGQPSVPFLANTLQQASSRAAPVATVQAAQAARAGAPPRMVAKIKAGQTILDGGKY